MQKQRFIISFLAVMITLIIGAMVLTGWFTRNDVLLSVIPGAVKMKFNLALGFVLSSVVVLLGYVPGNSKGREAIAAVLSAIILLMGLLSLSEYLFHINTGIDELFVKDKLKTVPGFYAGRMSPLSAVNLILIGIALFSLNKAKWAVYQYYSLSLIAFTSFLIIVSFNMLAGIPVFLQVAIHSAIGFMCLAAAIWFSQPQSYKKISFERKLFTGFTAVIILIVIIGLLSNYYNNRRIATARLVAHTNEVLSETEQTLSIAKDLEGGSRGYVITRDSAYLEHFNVAKDILFSRLTSLAELTKDNPGQQDKINRLSDIIARRIQFSLQTVIVRNEQGMEAASKLVAGGQGKIYMDRIRDLISAIREEEKKLLQQRKIENENTIVSFNRVFLIFLGGVFLLLLVMLFSIRSNISIRKRAEAQQRVAEEKMKENEQFFSDLFFKSPVMKTIAEADTGKFVEVNDAFAQFMGYGKKAMIGKTAADLDILTDMEQRNNVENQLRRDGCARNVETVITANGKRRWVSMNIDRIKLYNKDCLLTASIDITERKNAEENLLDLSRKLEQKVEERTREIKRSEEKYRSTLDNMLEGAQIIGFDWRYKYVNEALARHAKYSREELIGHTVMEKYPGIEKAPVFKLYERCFTERVNIHLENEFTFPDGSKGWFELSFQPVPEGIFILSIDITERKRIEEELTRSEKIYKTIASSIPDSVICLLDRDFRYLLIEGDMLGRLGYSKNKLLGNKAVDVLPEEVFAEIKAEFGKVLQGETITRESERNGVDTISKLIPLKDENNYVYSIMTVAMDITKLKNAQRAIAGLNQALELKVAERTSQLESVNKELEAFSYSVSHDLRAPLRGIVGFTEMLEEKYTQKLDTEANRITSIIKSNTLKMGVLIDDLLAFSRMSRQEIVKANIPTATLVNEIVREVDAQPGHITWKIHSLPDSFGDIKTIRQVWVNLIANAKKYSSKSASPQIEIGCLAQSAVQTVFYVKDNGVGFDSKYKMKLFKVFQRLHGNDEFEGTGVGLAIVHKIISKHGGKVWAEAEKNEGAVFYFTLPAKEK